MPAEQARKSQAEATALAVWRGRPTDEVNLNVATLREKAGNRVILAEAQEMSGGGRFLQNEMSHVSGAGDAEQTLGNIVGCGGDNFRAKVTGQGQVFCDTRFGIGIESCRGTGIKGNPTASERGRELLGPSDGGLGIRSDSDGDE